MLRKSGRGSATSSRYDDEKGGKVKRQTKQRIKSTLLFLATFALVGAGALYMFRDSTDFDPFGPGLLRGRSLKRQILVSNPSLLPPDSIYHISVEDCDGNK